ncbi:MAG: tyrosine--tRNA ligase [Phycisphaerales bacterium]|nr:MAG: tyrosine--tRNA ligase [Phycisphaerales bacterium]
MPEAPSDLLHELKWRGLLHQATSEDDLRAHLAEPRRIYCGFDPTAPSLTIGNLVPIMLLRHAQRAGHTPVVIMGGATGLIGDPSGKSEERRLLTPAQVDEHIAAQRRIFERTLDLTGERAAVILNNHDWIGRLSFIEALRDVGKHFSVNAMMQKDSVRDRLHNREQGISYTEFSYQILQSYDFLRLRWDQKVTVQCGGSDQWGNIIGGVDLVRRVLREEVFGFTAPLVTKADGGKFGKSEAGAVWLTADRTSPYAFHQFWFNCDDRDVGRYLRMFTFLTLEEIEALEADHAANPGARSAHRALANHVTEFVHGEAERLRAEQAAQALFSGDVAGLDAATLDEVFAGAPSSEHPLGRLAGEGVGMVDLLVETGLAKSKREAREFLQNGSVSVNGDRVGPDDRLRESSLMHKTVALLRRGKKTWHVTRWR